jgi:hypothetical protein
MEDSDCPLTLQERCFAEPSGRNKVSLPKLSASTHHLRRDYSVQIGQIRPSNPSSSKQIAKRRSMINNLQYSMTKLLGDAATVVVGR